MSRNNFTRKNFKNSSTQNTTKIHFEIHHMCLFVLKKFLMFKIIYFNYRIIYLDYSIIENKEPKHLNMSFYEIMCQIHKYLKCMKKISININLFTCNKIVYFLLYYK